MDALSATTAASTPATTTPTSAATPAAAGAFAAELAKAKDDLKKGERLSMVEGHAFARIKGGTRHDMCVNVSGNARSGQAFDLIFRNGRTFHVYGDGKDKVVVEVKEQAATTGTTGPAATPKATGGTTAA
ncbi:MAG: hypothetical protein HZB46_16725 [Solirubrobacterales bacterium]|nr:hypothetical protein [Solirubrobacterales bacterium]